MKRIIEIDNCYTLAREPLISSRLFMAHHEISFKFLVDKLLEFIDEEMMRNIWEQNGKVSLQMKKGLK